MIALAVAIGAPRAAAQTKADEAKVVKLAESAFEYRDFKKVVEILGGLTIERIIDRGHIITARRLLGVSLHILGEEKAAKKEFSRLLEEDPRHELDPFVIPPKVIEAFELVREEMRPKLEEILKKRGETEPKVEKPTEVQVVPTPHPAVMWMPFGVPQFRMDSVALGFLFGGLQVAGWSANVTAFYMAKNGRQEESTFDARVAIMYAGLGTAVFAWIGSVIHAYLTVDDYTAPIPSVTVEEERLGFSMSFTF